MEPQAGASPWAGLAGWMALLLSRLHLGLGARLEWEPYGEDPVVVIHVKMGRSDLKSPAH